jgi:hypothetical protein
MIKKIALPTINLVRFNMQCKKYTYYQKCQNNLNASTFPIFIMETADLISYTIHSYYLAPIMPSKAHVDGKQHTKPRYLYSWQSTCPVKTAISVTQQKPLICLLF